MRAFIEESQEDVPLERRVNHIGKRLKTRNVSWIGEYDMNYIILDMGYYVDILTRKKLGEYGKYKTSMVSYPIKISKSIEGFTYRLTNLGSCQDRRNSHLCRI